MNPKGEEDGITRSPPEVKKSILKIKITGNTPSASSITYYKEM
jgi:hypothetical protein